MDILNVFLLLEKGTDIFHLFQKLTKGKGKGNANWSISEIVHAVVILTHYHSLASFVFGCGINPEIDHESGHTFRPPSPPSDGNGTSTSITNSSGRNSPQVCT